MCRLDIHADDYALSPNTSEDILQCLRAGKLNSISVLTNMACYKAYAEKFRREKAEWPRQPLLAVHLNFMEGHCTAVPEEVKHLTDKQGYFNITWGDLFRWNYSPKMFMTINLLLGAAGGYCGTALPDRVYQDYQRTYSTLYKAAASMEKL